MHPKDVKPNQPDWLRRVQELSYEPELLISGLVLFALFQVPDLITTFNNNLNQHSYTLFTFSYLDDIVASFFKISIYWLIFGFGLHIILRSIWVAFVGMSYVYSDGIDFSKLNFQSRFQNLAKRQSSYQERVLKLEKWCSTVFAVSFLFFGFILGMACYLTLIIVLLSLTIYFLPSFLVSTIPFYVLLFLGVLHLFDFITLGSLRKIPYFSRIYYPMYRFIRVVTLAPFYESIYEGIVSNHSRWKVGTAIFTFLLISVGLLVYMETDSSITNTVELSVHHKNQYLIYSGHYADQYGKHPSYGVQIPSEIIRGNVLRVFAVHSTRYERNYIMKGCHYHQQIENNEAINTDSLKVACLNKFYVLAVDDSTYDSSGMYHRNPQTQQEGLVSWLDISDFPKGKHTLSLFYRFQGDSGNSKQAKKAIVEFYKTKPRRGQNMP